MAKSHFKGPIIVRPAGSSGWFFGQNAAGDLVIGAGEDVEAGVALTIDSSGNVQITSLETDLVASSGLIKQENATGAVELTGDDAADQGANLKMYGASHATKADDWELRDAGTNVLSYDKSATLITAAQKVLASGEVEIDGALNHDGSTVGFYAVTPVARASAYTQTYSTADRTVAAMTAAALTVTDGAGTNDGTIGAITADASVIAAVQELAAQINKLVVDVLDNKQSINALIDDSQAIGISQ